MLKIEKSDNKEYLLFLKNILEKVKKTRYEMLKTVSSQTVLLYFEIGKSVSKNAKKEKWWKAVVEKLSKDLQLEFEWVRWFSSRNIWRMKLFYEFFEENEKLPLMVAEIWWSQNCVILEKCKDENKINFYLKKTKEKWWSKLDLIEKINTNYFENYLLSQNNFKNTVSEELKWQVAWEFLDDYNVELINPDQPISELEDYENNLIKNKKK